MNQATLIDGCMQALDEMINLANRFYQNEIDTLAHPRNTDYLQTISFEIENAKLFRKQIAALESEKLGEGAEKTVYKIYMLDKCESDKPAIKILMDFAYSYHATQCAICDKLRKKLALSAYHQQHDSDIELTAERE